MGKLWFTPDGHEVYRRAFHDSSSVYDKWEIVKDSESGTTKLQPLWETGCPPGSLPWVSSLGYEVTDNGWILDPTQRRLLWLPHHWRSHREHRTWHGQFLGFSHKNLLEVVILDFSI